MVPVDDDTVPVAAMVEGIVGCKWALSLLDHLEQGVRRPGELQRRVDGLSTKVMNERLRKMVRFGILARTEFPEVPPRVEYELTPLGRRFTELLAHVKQLQAELDRGELDRNELDREDPDRGAPDGPHAGGEGPGPA